jgi:hypothetical protein
MLMRPALRYLQIIPVALVLYATDAVDRFRAGAQAAGLAHAPVANTITRQLGGGFAVGMNGWLAAHQAVADAAAWFYVLMMGAVAGTVGLLLIWRRAPSFGLHRNALICCNLIALVVFWLYPVAPPRMLPGYHDITATSVPVFSGVLEGKGADLFAALPSLHVAWSLWVPLAVAPLVRNPVLRAALWLYPAATIADVLATANHYLLDAITAPGVLVLGYASAAGLAVAAGRLRRCRQVRRPVLVPRQAPPEPGEQQTAPGARRRAA